MAANLEQTNLKERERIYGGKIIAEGVSYEDYLSERYGRHVEWVGGVIVAMPQPTIHELNLRWFLRCFFEVYLDSTSGGKVFSDPFTMKTGDSLPARQPDVYIVLPERLSLIKECELAGPANLVVEIVSPESVGRDWGEKFHEYEKGGVDEYWIIDPAREEALFYVRGEDGLFRNHPAVAGIYASSVLANLKLQVDILWRENLPTTPEIVTMVGRMLAGDKP